MTQEMNGDVGGYKPSSSSLLVSETTPILADYDRTTTTSYISYSKYNAVENGGYDRLGKPHDDGDLDVPARDLRAMIQSAQEPLKNKLYLEQCFGGLLNLAAGLGVDLLEGLSKQQVEEMKEKYGSNIFPDPPMKSFISFFVSTLGDPVLLILIGAAIVSSAVSLSQGFSEEGWLEGVAIITAVIIITLVTSINDYTKELQFRALDKITEEGDSTLVVRCGQTQVIHVEEVVVGDIVVLKVGDQIPADGILFEGEGVTCNESMLTGEPIEHEKVVNGSDPFLYSSCLVSEIRNNNHAKILVTGVGSHCEWGKIRRTIVKVWDITPLQKQLALLAAKIGYVGLSFAIVTFITLVSIDTAKYKDNESRNNDFVGKVLEAFIIAVTVIVVAIPEGLPLAVTISLAYSTVQMYKSKNLIRTLSACEIMGNATTICTDKTGTLTMNQMTVTEAYTGCKHMAQEEFIRENLAVEVAKAIVENISCNCSTEVYFKDRGGHDLFKPSVVGSPMEGALLLLAYDWGANPISLKRLIFDTTMGDREYPFTSARKRSTIIIRSKDSHGLRLYCKGASETLLDSCVAYVNLEGSLSPINDDKRQEINEAIVHMAGRALRTLCLAHKDYKSVEELPEGWEMDPPDEHGLIMDALVGIQDGLRSGVKEAVSTAQQAGVVVRMITGDSLHTAKAIASECGILTQDGIVLEGPVFRKLTPAELDEVLPYIQVIARPTPNDKYLFVARLNGYNLPKNEREWLDYHDHDGTKGLSWMKHRDLLLPGYLEEWKRGNPDRGEVVGVTGDGTNDAPALTAANVGIGMGLCGTKVSQFTSDIVMLDDQFSSIVKAITWGRCVYDNIRRFLQFQLTVNVVGLTLVFVGAVSVVGPPLGAIMMLWVNLIMDSMGALALGTEHPTPELLKRRPYKRSAKLICRPMLRNIVVQATYQLCILLWLLFYPQPLFGSNLRLWNPCDSYSTIKCSNASWDMMTGQKDPNGTVECSTFAEICGTSNNWHCYETSFQNLNGFYTNCLECTKTDFTHFTIIFNTFVFCQIFNEFNSRSLFDDWHILKGITSNLIFCSVILVTIGCQVLIVEFGGEPLRTTSLSLCQWLISSALGFGAIPVGFLMRFIPIVEDQSSFATSEPGFPTKDEDSTSELLATIDELKPLRF